jgi:hypothetical protein
MYALRLLSRIELLHIAVPSIKAGTVEQKLQGHAPEPLSLLLQRIGCWRDDQDSYLSDEESRADDADSTGHIQRLPLLKLRRLTLSSYTINREGLFVPGLIL